MAGELGGKPPVVAGHESAGYIDKVGEGVTAVKPGDPVVVSLLRSCGQCYYCKTGYPNMCEARWPLDTEIRLHNKKGEDVARGLCLLQWHPAGRGAAGVHPQFQTTDVQHIVGYLLDV